MLADHAARVAPVGTGLAAEARCMRDELQRQLFQRHDLVAHHVGDRHFGGRNQVKILLTFFTHLARHAKQVFLKFWQLSGTTHRIGIDQIRHIHFGVAVLVGMRVEHELRERAVQPRQPALQQREARAADLHGGVEIQSQPFADADVVLHLEIEFRNIADLAHFQIVRLGLAHRHAVMRGIGDHRKKGIQLVLYFTQTRLELLELVTEVRHFRHDRRGVLAFRLGLPDQFG